jgi:hypothetical protein
MSLPAKEEQYVTITCKRYLSDFCYNDCAYRTFGCAGEHKFPRKKKHPCIAKIETLTDNLGREFKICRYGKAYNECLRDKDPSIRCTL